MQKPGQVPDIKSGMFIAAETIPDMRFVRVIEASHCSDASSAPRNDRGGAVVLVSAMVELTLKHLIVACCMTAGLLLGIGNDVPPLMLAGAVVAGDVDGKRVYVQTCAACHANGVAGAPRFGSRGDWAKRLSQGRKELERAVLKGKDGMPPKGGNASLTDVHAMAALDYILSGLR